MIRSRERNPPKSSCVEGVIFRVPELYHTDAPPRYVTADEYLSGNVRDKLRTAEIAARTSEEYKVNAEALQMAQPTDLDASEIEVRIGSTWIDKAYMQEFMYALFDTPYTSSAHTEYRCLPLGSSVRWGE